MQKKSNVGFTLVELLAVIVLLAILVVLSFPKIVEMVNRENADIDEAKLNLMYTATRAYIFDHNNQFPEREGNTYCISPKVLEDEDYVAFDTSELKAGYVVKVSYFSEEEFQFAYVKDSSCKSSGVVNSELAGLTCTIDKTGYSVNKKVTVNYPTGNNFVYQYSLDEGRTWSEVTTFDAGHKLYFNFTTAGSVLAKVTMNGESSGSLSCSAYVEQIDPTPIGTVIAFAGTLVPQGYLLADGSTVLKSRFEELYDLIGTTYGVPGNSKVFYLPNMQGKIPVGTSTSSDLTLGYSGGEKNHTLTVGELPAHTHTFTGVANKVTSSSGAHTHDLSETTNQNGSHIHPQLEGSNVLTIGSSEEMGSFTDGLDTSGDFLSDKQVGYTMLESAGAHTHTFAGTTASASTTHTHTFQAAGTNSDVGGGSAHNNMMPYYTINYIIKYQ